MARNCLPARDTMSATYTIGLACAKHTAMNFAPPGTRATRYPHDLV